MKSSEVGKMNRPKIKIMNTHVKPVYLQNHYVSWGENAGRQGHWPLCGQLEVLDAPPFRGFNPLVHIEPVKVKDYVSRPMHEGKRFDGTVPGARGEQNCVHELTKATVVLFVFYTFIIKAEAREQVTEWDPSLG